MGNPRRWPLGKPFGPNQAGSATMTPPLMMMATTMTREEEQRGDGSSAAGRQGHMFRPISLGDKDSAEAFQMQEARAIKSANPGIAAAGGGQWPAKRFHGGARSGCFPTGGSPGPAVGGAAPSAFSDQVPADHHCSRETCVPRNAVGGLSSRVLSRASAAFSSRKAVTNTTMATGNLRRKTHQYRSPRRGLARRSPRPGKPRRHRWNASAPHFWRAEFLLCPHEPA